ncbi:hypothetical protein Tco_0281513 [Tanacetum coccineum]
MIESISGVRGTGLLDVASSVGILDRCSNNSKPLHGWSTSDNHDVGLGLGFKRMRCCRIVHHSRIRLHDIGWFVSLVVGLCCSCSGLFCLGMERGFLFQNGSGESNNTMNEDTSVGVASVVMEGVAPSMVDMTVEMKKLRSLKDTTVLGYFPPLSTSVTTSAGNAPGKSLYANVTGKLSGKKLNIRTLFTPGGNGIDVVVPMKSIRAINEQFPNTTYYFFLGKRVAYPIVTNYVKLHGVPVTAFSEDGFSAIATKLGTPLMLDSYTSYMCMQSWGRSSYASVMIKLRADVELIDNTWLCLKLLGAGEKMTLKNPCQTSRGVPFGSKIGFKPQKKYRLVPKKPTASSSSNMKKGVVPTIEVNNSNPFKDLNLVDNDVELVFPDDYDNEDEVASVDNDMARSMASERVDPYDDDMYEGQDLPQELQAICDNLDIRVRGRKKK